MVENSKLYIQKGIKNKELLELNHRKTDNPVEKWAKGLNCHFSKKDMQVSNKHTKGYTTLVNQKDS